MPSKRSSRPRQTRLAFTPLPSSSPAAQDYNKQIQDRAAAVTLEGSPSPAKRRKIQHTNNDLLPQSLNGDTYGPVMIPTPATSLERFSRDDHDIDESDEQPIRSTQRKATAKARVRQQRLDFASVRDPDSFDSPLKLPSSSTRSRSRGGMFSSQAQGQIVSSDDSDASDVLPSAKKLRTHAREEKKKARNNGVQTRTRRRSQMPTNEHEEESDEIAAAGNTQAEQNDQEDSDDDMPTTAGKQSRKRRRERRSSFVVDSPTPAPDSDDDLVVIDKPSRKRRRQVTESEEEEDEDDAPRTPGRRSLKARRQLSQREKDDLAEDLEFLEPSSDDEQSARMPRSSQSVVKSARQIALERLKRSRSGQLPQVDEDEESDGVGDDANDFHELVDDDDDDDDDDEIPQITSSRQMFAEDPDDADFVEEQEDDGILGVPDGVPLEFTRYASMKPKELFKYAVEWMVQKKINPAFSMTDDIYNLTFRKLDDEVRGLAGSKFTSSAWTPQFTVALEARPEMATERIDRSSAEHYMRDKCDACNRSGHPATWEIQFQGKPYHRETLEDVANDDDEGENEDSDSETSSNHPGNNNDDDHPSYDELGREVVPVSTTFFVGKFCKSNAETAHKLRHWRWFLNQWVQAFLASKGHLNAAKLVERDGWSIKKRSKYANKIVDRMEREGDISRLWREFNINTQDARMSKQGRFAAPDSP